jgi:hypothetical protein
VTREWLGSKTADELAGWAANYDGNGCLPAATAAALPATVVDSLPLDLNRRRQLKSPPLATRGSLELTSASSLRVVSPVFRSAGPSTALGQRVARVSEGPRNTINVELEANEELAGYEVAWYDVKARDDGSGLTIVPRSAEVHLGDKVEKTLAPRVNHLYLNPDARWLRYFVMTRAAENNYNIVVLTGPTPAELERRSTAFRNDASAWMAAAPTGSYASMTREVGVNPFLRVSIQGSPADIPAGSSLAQAIEHVTGAGTAAKARATLSLRKLHRGKLVPVDWDRKSLEILELAIEGGEEISW